MLLDWAQGLKPEIGTRLVRAPGFELEGEGAASTSGRQAATRAPHPQFIAPLVTYTWQRRSLHEKQLRESTLLLRTPQYAILVVDSSALGRT
jgi:hypothetical protein